MTVLQRLSVAEFDRPVDEQDDERMTWLLADFLACAQAGGADDPSVAAGIGAGDLAGRLALQAGSTDLDDVDWHSMHHPGAIVWSTLLSLASQVQATGQLLGRAARCGYGTAASMADLLGPAHRARWHVTATAGAIAAAASAGVLLGLDEDGRQRAMSLAAANAGGLALAARERRGAAAFNRAAAAVLGITAAQAAAAGAVAIDDPIGSPLGLLEAMAGSQATGHLTIRSGIAQACPRLYPATGFLQSALDAVACARQECSGGLLAMHVEVAPAVVPMVSDAEHGPWWDARLCLLRTWAHADASQAGTPSSMDAQASRVQIAAADLPIGHARVRIDSDGAAGWTRVLGPPGQQTSDFAGVLPRKWAVVLDIDAGRPIARARELLAS